MHYVYILVCSDRTYYVGLTDNLRKRLQEHIDAMCHYTKSRLPITLVWYAAFRDKKKAAEFEQYLKSGSGNAFFKKRFV